MPVRLGSGHLGQAIWGRAGPAPISGQADAPLHATAVQLTGRLDSMDNAPILVSACLLGVPCNHNGEGRLVAAIDTLRARTRLIPVCPEVAGGLPTPRPYAELGSDGRVRTPEGEDLTGFYERGAAQAVALARAAGARRAVLKARSPSCGSYQTYDGTFRRVLVEREGVTASALRRAGVEVVSEEELQGSGT